MITLELQPKGAAGAPITVTWDQDAGEISGPGAPEIRKLIDAVGDHVISEPYPTEYVLTDPLGDRRQFAALIASRWILPEALADALPQEEDAEAYIVDEDGNRRPIEVLY